MNITKVYLMSWVYFVHGLVLVCQSVIRCMCQYVSVFVYVHVFALVCPFVIGCCKSADLIYLSLVSWHEYLLEMCSVSTDGKRASPAIA